MTPLFCDRRKYTIQIDNLLLIPFDNNYSMSGIPGLSVPAGLDGQGLPLGLQVLGRPFDEETVFAVGAALERGSCALSLGAGCVGTWVSGAEYAYFRKKF